MDSVEYEQLLATPSVAILDIYKNHPGVMKIYKSEKFWRDKLNRDFPEVNVSGVKDLEEEYSLLYNRRIDGSSQEF